MAITDKLLFVPFIFYQVFKFFTMGNSFNISVDTLSLGTPKNFTLNNSIIYVIEVQNLPDVIETVPPKIFVRCENCIQENPLLVVVDQNKGVMSWELPVIIETNDYHAVYRNMERTLCPFDVFSGTNSSGFRNSSKKISDGNIHPVILSLATSNKLNVSVEIIVNLEKNFVIELNKNKSVQVTPSTPAFYLYQFEQENVTSVLLHITSEDDTCMIVSVQNVSCPVFDLEENVAYRGKYQTMSRQGALTLTKEAFPNGFYVVLIVSGEDKYCEKAVVNSPPERTKNAVIFLTKTISSDEYMIAVSVTLSVIILFCTVMYVVFYCIIKREKKVVPDIDDELIIDNDLEASTSAQYLPYNVTSPVTPVTPGADTLSVRTDSSLDETDFDLVNDAELDKNIFRMKAYLYLCDLARKNQSVLKKKSDLYFWNLLTVAIFYFLPVIQLVFTDQYVGIGGGDHRGGCFFLVIGGFSVQRQNQSGREDLCYYNFLCSHPLWWFSDFNHIFSNIGYITLGGLFMILTVMKERVYKMKICSDKKLYRCYGIPQHFGIFYAMGAALIIEGVLSSCYHICPNHYNFQFDTSFMYVICTLCMIKIYQTRHPDINANAYATFSLLAGVIVLGMYGVFSSNLTFWVLFTIVHLSTCTYLSLNIYYMGRFKLEFINVARWFKELQPCRGCHWRFFLPMFPSRFMLLILANLCNWGLAVGSFIFQIKNFSSYLLAIFMVNLLLYTAFYILMKFICKEKLPLQSVVYILLATLCWAAALYFFFKRTISWRLTPAESKLYNQKCKLMDFYDNHDIWHFISAAAMFFSFMVLLTLDNDLIYVHRSKIVVF